MNKASVIFVAGRAGAGKGTQCSKLSEELGYHHINVGAILRAEKENYENADRDIIARCMNAGNIVPAEVTCRLLDKRMGEIAGSSMDDNHVFLLDGFPRDMGNVNAWNGSLSKKYNLKFLLCLNCSEEICFKRLLNRGKTSGRADDVVEGIKKRLPDHITFTEPAVQHYSALGLVKEVDAERPVDEVFADVRKIFLDAL